MSHLDEFFPEEKKPQFPPRTFEQRLTAWVKFWFREDYGLPGDWDKTLRLAWYEKERWRRKCFIKDRRLNIRVAPNRRQMEVLHLRDAGLTFREIAERIGATKERAVQIHKKATWKIAAYTGEEPSDASEA